MVELLCGDARAMLRGLPAQSVHCAITSPPYFGLRAYNGGSEEIGTEQTPQAYVAALVDVFRGIWRVLRDDGTLWIVISDSYSGGGGFWPNAPSNLAGSKQTTQHGSIKGRRGGVGANLPNCLESSIKGGFLCLSGRHALTFAPKGKDVLGPNHLPPDAELASLLGIQRIFLKQRDHDLCQVLYLLHPECRVRVVDPIRLVKVGETDAEIILDATDDISVVVSELDLQPQPALVVPTGAVATQHRQTAFTVEQSAEPVAKSIGHAEAPRNAFSLDSAGKGVLQVDLVDDLIAAGQGLAATAQGLRDFHVTEASKEHLALSLLQGRLDLAIRGVGHLLVSNSYGSLVHYYQLYDQAYRESNTLRPKQELSIPDRVKRALQEDSWICRQTLIWHKPNPMPESVKDRCTRAHETVFMLAKQARYWYDADAIAEPVSAAAHGGQVSRGGPKHAPRDATFGRTSHGGPRSTLGLAGHQTHASARNKRSVWTVATAPLSSKKYGVQTEHYAAFPPELVRPMVRAGCPPDGVVLDPFCGSGTTGLVAVQEGQRFIGIDLREDYLQLAAARISQATELASGERASLRRQHGLPPAPSVRGSDGRALQGSLFDDDGSSDTAPRGGRTAAR